MCTFIRKKQVSMSVVKDCDGEYLQRLFTKHFFIFYLSAPVQAYVTANKRV